MSDDPRIVDPETARTLETPQGEDVVVLTRGDEPGEEYDLLEFTIPREPGAVPLHVHHDNDEAFSLVEYTAAPDGPSPPVHVHEETDEVIYVLEGTTECTVGDDIFTAEAGATVTIPSGTRHTLSTIGTQPCSLLALYSPAGFEEYFEEMGRYLQSLPPGPPDMEKVAQKAAELGEIYDQVIFDSASGREGRSRQCRQRGSRDSPEFNLGPPPQSSIRSAREYLNERGLTQHLSQRLTAQNFFSLSRRT